MLAAVSPTELAAGCASARQQLHEMAEAAAELQHMEASGGKNAVMKLLQEHASRVGAELAATAVKASCQVTRLAKLVQLPASCGFDETFDLTDHHLDGLLAAGLSAILAATEVFAERLPAECGERILIENEAGGTPVEQRPAYTVAVSSVAMEAAETACAEAASKLVEVGVAAFTQWMADVATDAAVQTVEHLLETDGSHLSDALGQVLGNSTSNLMSLQQYLLGAFDEKDGGKDWGARVATSVLRRHVAVYMRPELQMFVSMLQAESAVAMDKLEAENSDKDSKEIVSDVSKQHSGSNGLEDQALAEDLPEGEKQVRSQTWEQESQWPAALVAKFTGAGPLGFTVEQRRELTTGRFWMEVSAVKPDGQAAQAGLSVGLYLYKVQGHIVVGLGRGEIMSLVSELRPLDVVFVTRDAGDFIKPEDDDLTEESSEDSDESDDQLDEIEISTSKNECFEGSSTSDDDGIDPTSSFAMTRIRTSAGDIASPAQLAASGSHMPQQSVIVPAEVLPAETSGAAAPKGAPVDTGAPKSATAKPKKPRKRSMLACLCPDRTSTPAAPQILSSRSLPVDARKRSPSPNERQPQLKAAVQPLQKAQRLQQSISPAPVHKSTTELAREREIRHVLEQLEAALHAKPPLGGKALAAVIRNSRDCGAAVGNLSVEKKCGQLERRLAEIRAEDDRLVDILKRAAEDATAASIPRVQQLLKTYRARGTPSASGSEKVCSAYSNLQQRLQQLCVEEERRRRILTAVKAVQRALWDTDHESMQRIADGYSPLAITPTGIDPNVDNLAAERMRLRKELEKLAALAAERRQQEQEELLMLASTRQLETAASSKNLQLMKEALDDHRPPEGGFDSKQVGEAWLALQQEVQRTERGLEKEKARQHEIAVKEKRRQQAVKQQQSHLARIQQQHRHNHTKQLKALQKLLTSKDTGAMLATVNQYSNDPSSEVQALLTQIRERCAEIARTQRDGKRRAARQQRIIKLRQELARATPGQATKLPADLAGPAGRRPAQGGDDLSKTQAASKQMSPDAKFHDRFEWKGLLGEGGFGQVVAAWDKKHQRRVAIKVVRPTGSSSKLSDEEIRRLVREAKGAVLVDHPNCMKCFGFYPNLDRQAHRE